MLSSIKESKTLGHMLKEPTHIPAQLVPTIRDLVFANAKAYAEKTKRAVFLRPIAIGTQTAQQTEI
jgi:hypothetical protein